MFWLFFCFFSIINASEGPKTLTDLPIEVVKKIAEYEQGSSVKISTKPFYEKLFIPDVETYIKLHENPEATARANLFARNFNLEYFKQDAYAGMPLDLREKNSAEYQKFMQDPVFFLTFAPFHDGFTIPNYLEERIQYEKIEVPEEHIPIHLFTPLTEEKNKIPDGRCIVIHDDLSKNQFQKYLNHIEAMYKGSFTRLLVRNLIRDHKNSFGKSNEYDYTNWPAKYIIQDSIDGNTLFHNFDNNLANYNEINTDILKTKSSYGRTPLFYQPSDTIRLFSNVYINERDGNGFSALGWQLYRYRKRPPEEQSGEIRNNLIKNIKSLVEKEIRLDIQSFVHYKGKHVPSSNPIHEAVAISDLEILKIVSAGKGFDGAINQKITDKVFTISVTALDYIRMFSNVLPDSEQIITFLESKGALTSLYVELGMNPLHFFAQYPDKIVILQDLLEKPYYQSLPRINKVDDRDNTPLDYAILKRNAEAITLLESYGGKKNSQTIKGKIRFRLYQMAFITLLGVLVWLKAKRGPNTSPGLLKEPFSPHVLQWRNMLSPTLILPRIWIKSKK